MDNRECFIEELNNKKRSSREIIFFLNGVIRDARTEILKLEKDGEAVTITYNSEDGPQPSTKQDDANAIKILVNEINTLLNSAKAKVTL